MKNELTPIGTGDVLVLKNGEIVYVMEVDPINRVNHEDSSRNCDCRIGHIYKTGEKKKPYVGFIEDMRHNQIYAIDVSKIKSFTLDKLYPMIAANLGKVTEDKIKLFRKLTADFYDSL